MAGMFSGALEWATVQIHRLRVQRQFRHDMGFDGDFENPRSHAEKIQFRKIYGNHRFYARLTDKYRVREYVTVRVGEKYLVPLLGVYQRLEAKDFDSLPKRFVIKANHGCNWQEVVRDKHRLDIDATVRRFNKYLGMRYGAASGERHYGFIQPRILIEELLEDETGGCAWNYCFFCCNSPSGAFDYVWSIVAPDGRHAAFNRDGEMLESHFTAQELKPHLDPPNFSRMVQVARALSADFDFVRVDLYNVRGRIYFGELTITPGQGHGQAEPPRRQPMRDEMWQLDAHNRLLYRAPRSYGKRAKRRTQELAPVIEPTDALTRT